MSDFRTDKIVQYLDTRDCIYLYEKISMQVIAAMGSVLYARGAKINYSTDTGKTWTVINGEIIFDQIHISNKYTVYGFVKIGGSTKVYRSTNFVDFTEVDMSAFGIIGTVTPYAFDSNSDTFIFCESNSSISPTETEARLFRTTDGGLTFTAVLSASVGYADAAKIGHFHNVTYIGGATIYNEPDTWIATTGDHNDNVKWYKSVDNGATWTLVPGISGQKFRTLHIDRQADNWVIWATDAVPAQLSGIYRANLSDIAGTVELVHPLALTSWGSRVRAKGFCVTVREGSSNDGVVYLYASGDAGKTWQIEKELSVRNHPVNHDQPGFHNIVGPDGEGSMYIQGVALRDVQALKIKNKKQYIL